MCFSAFSEKAKVLVSQQQGGSARLPARQRHAAPVWSRFSTQGIEPLKGPDDLPKCIRVV
jgi:hypothetical protein